MIVKGFIILMILSYECDVSKSKRNPPVGWDSEPPQTEFLDLSAAISDASPAAITQPATEFAVLQVLAMFGKGLSLWTAYLINGWKVVDDKNA